MIAITMRRTVIKISITSSAGNPKTAISASGAKRLKRRSTGKNKQMAVSRIFYRELIRVLTAFILRKKIRRRTGLANNLERLTTPARYVLGSGFEKQFLKMWVTTRAEASGNVKKQMLELFTITIYFLS